MNQIEMFEEWQQTDPANARADDNAECSFESLAETEVEALSRQTVPQQVFEDVVAISERLAGLCAHLTRVIHGHHRDMEVGGAQLFDVSDVRQCTHPLCVVNFNRFLEITE